MSGFSSDKPFPRGALVGAACLIGLSLLVTASVQLAGIETSQVPEASRVDQRLVRFADRADGAVIVRDAETGSMIEVLEPGTNGFVRAVLRGFARQRRAQGIGSAPAFALVLWDDGRLSLNDPATGRSAQLNAFGPTNLAAFSELLRAEVEVAQGDPR